MKAPVLILDESLSVADVLATLGVSFDLAGVDEFDHALEQARLSPPAAIVLSADLERGYAFCRRIKKDPILGSVRVVLTSIRKTAEEFHNHAQLPTRADAYLLAPFAPAALREALQLPDAVVSAPLDEVEFGPFTLQETIPVTDPEPAPVPAPQSVQAVAATSIARTIADYDFSAFEDGGSTRLATADEASLLDAFDPPAREPPPPSASALARELEEISLDVLDSPMFTSSGSGHGADVFSSVPSHADARSAHANAGLSRPSRSASVSQQRDERAWDFNHEVHVAEDDWQLEGALGTDHPLSGRGPSASPPPPARPHGSETGLGRTVPATDAHRVAPPSPQVNRLDVPELSRAAPEPSHPGLGSFGQGLDGGVPSGTPSRDRTRPAPEVIGGRVPFAPGLPSGATSRLSAPASTLDTLLGEIQTLLATLETERAAAREAEATYRVDRERIEEYRPALEAELESLRERVTAQNAELAELRTLYSDALSTLEATETLLAQPLAAIARHKLLRRTAGLDQSS